MTIILAGKYSGGINVLYDTVGYYKILRFLIPLTGVKKVQPIYEGNGFIGMSGGNVPEKEFAKFDRLTKGIPENRRLGTINQIIAADKLMQISSNRGDKNRSYIVGITEPDGLHLLISDAISDTQLREVDFYGIGSGMRHPEVLGMLKDRYKPDLDSSKSLYNLQMVFKLAWRLDREKEGKGRSTPIKGLGEGVLDSTGYRQLFIST